MEGNPNTPNKTDSAWWKPAVAMFMQVSAWVGIPVIIALFVGKYLDKRYDSAPWFFLGSMGLAFAVSIIAIGRIAFKYIRNLEKEIKDKKDQINNK